MQVGEQRPPVADCFHRRSYLFMLSHFQISDMFVFLTHQPFIIQKSTDIHFFCRNTFHGIFLQHGRTAALSKSSPSFRAVIGFVLSLSLIHISVCCWRTASLAYACRVSAIRCSAAGLLPMKSLNRMNDLIPDCKITGRFLLDGEDIYADGVDTNVLRRRIGTYGYGNYSKSDSRAVWCFQNDSS